MRRILLALTLLLVGMRTPSIAAELQLDPKLGSGTVLEASSVLRDPTGRWTLGDVIARHAAFAPATSLVPDLHAWFYAPSTLWFRLAPRATSAGPWYLHTTVAVDRAEMYFVPPTGEVARVAFGTLVPYNERQLPATMNEIALPERATREGTLYLKVVTREDAFGGFSIRPVAWEATTGRVLADQRLLPELIIIGLIGGLALFNGLFGLTLRERIYYWYAAAAGCFTLLEFITTGAAWRWLWPNGSVLFDVAVYPAYLCYLALMLAFADAFLELRTTQRALWRAIVGIFVCGALGDTAFIFVPNIFDRTNLIGVFEPLSSGCLLSAVFASGAIAWRRGCVGARPFTFAYSGVLGGILVGTLGNGLILPSNAWTNAAPALGVAWEAVFLALALAERIDRLRGERDTLKVEALVDALTGVANRRAFDRRLSEEWRRGLRGRTPVAAVLIDIDFFKSYNDEYGHVAGDRALKLVAGTLTSSSSRAEDFIARYGGEEFVVLLPYCSVADAADIADSMRAMVQALAITHAANPSGRLTISAGVACAVPTVGTTAEELVAAADRALYAAKRAGRNRVSEAIALVA